MRAPDVFDALRHREAPVDLPIGPNHADHGRLAGRVALWRLTPARRTAWLAEVKAGRFRPSTRIIAATIALYAERRGGAFPSVATIAREAGLSVRTIGRACRCLEDAGLLLRQARPTQSGAGGRWQWRYHPVVAAGRLDPHDLARMRAADPPLATDAGGLATALQAGRKRRCDPDGATVTIGQNDRSCDGDDRSDWPIVPCTAIAPVSEAKSLKSNDDKASIDAPRSVKMSDESDKTQDSLMSLETRASARDGTAGQALPQAPTPARDRHEEVLPPRAREIVVELEKALQKAPALARQPLQNGALRLARTFDQDLARRSETAFAALDNNAPGAAREAALAVVRPYHQWARRKNLLHDDGALGLVESQLKTLVQFVGHERRASR